MQSKTYNVIYKKLETLKSNTHLICNTKTLSKVIKSLEEIEDKLFLVKSDAHNKSETEFNAFLLTSGFLNKLNSLAMYYPRNIIGNYNKIILESADKVCEKTCPKCEIVLLKVKEGNCCDQCGYVEQILPIYYGERKYKPSKAKDSGSDHYCDEWLNYLQGKGIFNIPNELILCLINECRKICVSKDIKKIEKYEPEEIKKDVNLDLLVFIKCSHIRSWLSKYNGSKYNKYVPSIHRRLTRELGREIIPPQFDINEEKVILNDWRFLSETYCTQYKILKQKTDKKKNNNPYYPVCIFFIVKKRFNDERAIRLEEYIHKQSVETYRMRLQCWEKTCEILNYKPEFYYS